MGKADTLLSTNAEMKVKLDQQTEKMKEKEDYLAETVGKC